MWVVARVGRRLLTLVGLAINILLWTGVGIAGVWTGTVVVWYGIIPNSVLVATTN